jgi:predicted TIM-barrel fold metal-dependent hydrolase
MLWDFHTHLYDDAEYADVLAETAQNLGFDKLCIAGGEARYGMAPNEDVLEHARTYPDLFVPFAFVQLGKTGAADVEHLWSLGFRGLRVYGPPASYDSAEFYPVYEAAQTLGMPILFHTGFLPATAMDRALDVRVDRMRPVHLDAIARKFPSLKIVGSGLGAPWFEEACEVMRRHKNVYFDLSGDALRRKGADFYRSLLGSETASVLDDQCRGEAWTRVLFGTAVRYDEIAAVERDHQRLFRALALKQEVVENILSGNAARLLGLQRPEQ